MTGRKLLALELKAALPAAWVIVSDARQLTTVQAPGACVLWTQKRSRPAKLGLDWLLDEITLWVLTSADKPARIEDDLDELLETVLEALEPLPAFVWTEAERGVLADQFNGWRLTVTCTYKIGTPA